MRGTDTGLTASVVAYASAGADLVHAAVAPVHWAEWPLSGVFFLASATLQMLWAVAVVFFPRSPVLTVGLLLNTALMALWAVSRVWGIPAGPHAGVPEAVDVPGVMTMALEAVAVVAAAWFLLPRKQLAILSTGGYRVALAGTATVVLAFAVPGAAAALTHGHGHEDGGGSGGGHARQGEPRSTPSGNRPTCHDGHTASPSSTRPRPSQHDDGHDHEHGD
ncbi:MAG: hypothetical protein GEV07_01115 [Streptosporangiales bacterium]|nr:hypothetical protein [Streptosporangiales bacterium]